MKYYQFPILPIKIALIGLLAYWMIGLFSQTFAQATIAFPIEELGGCTNVQTCKVYCDQPQNHDACTSFAKEKGLAAGKTRVSEKHAAALASAKTELGCNTIDECKNVCETPANKTRCQTFAQKHGLAAQPPPQATSDEELLKAAKEKLGCESYDSCARLCDEEKNYTKCAALMQSEVTGEDRAMFDKYRTQIREFLGCDSIVTCMAFCMNPANTQKCTDLGNQIGMEAGDGSNAEPPEVWCPKISSECKWNGSDCVCNGPQSCSQNPECSWDGTNCNCQGSSTTYSESPEVWCPKAGEGCTWDGKQCTCPQTSTGPIQTGGGTQEPGEVWCPKVGPYCVWDGSSCTCWDDCVKSGGTWTGSRCEFPQSTPEPGEIWCPRNPGCVWTGSECQCTSVEAPQTEPTTQPAVQGTSTNRGLLQQLLDFLSMLH